MNYELEVGKDTEECLQFIFQNLNDEQVDQIDVERKHEDVVGVASEPVTSAALLNIPPELITSVVALISQWVLLKHKRMIAQSQSEKEIKLAEIKAQTDITLETTQASRDVSIAQIKAEQEESRMRAANESDRDLLAKFDVETLKRFGSIKAKNVSFKKV